MGIANIDALTAELAGLKAEYKIIANKLAAIPYPYNTASNPSWVALKNQLDRYGRNAGITFEYSNAPGSFSLFIKVLAAPVKLPVLIEEVTCVIAPVILLAPGIEFIAPLALSIIFDTALCAPGNPLNPVDALAGSVALIALTAFSALVTKLVDAPSPVVTALVTLANPLIADEAAPEAILAAFIPEFAAADFNTPATSPVSSNSRRLPSAVSKGSRR